MAASVTLIPGRSLPLRIIPDPIAERQPAVFSLMISGTAPPDFWADTRLYRAPGGIPVLGLVAWDEARGVDRPLWDPLRAMVEEAAARLEKRGFTPEIVAKASPAAPALRVELRRLEVFHGTAAIELAVERLDASGRPLERAVRSAWIPVPEQRLFDREAAALKRLLRSAGARLIVEAVTAIGPSA